MTEKIKNLVSVRKEQISHLQDLICAGLLTDEELNTCLRLVHILENEILVNTGAIGNNPAYCVNQDCLCRDCSLSNYGRDCQNNPIGGRGVQNATP